MKSAGIILVALLVTECTLLLTHGSPITTESTPTVEYLDSPSATEIVFEDSGSESLREESSDATESTTEMPEDSTSLDDLSVTTSIPCGNDLDSPDCSTLLDTDSSANDEIVIPTIDKTASNNNETISIASLSDDKTTTESPKDA